MSMPTISFSCPQCGKKFSAPSVAIGKQITCSNCSSKVTVPALGSVLAPHPQPSLGTPSAPTTAGAPATFGKAATSSPPTFGASASSSSTASRRDFPALKAVAGLIVFLSWVYVVLGVVGGIAAASMSMENAGPAALLIGILVVLVAGFIAICIRAVAEMIRLALYIAELLEDIRDR